MTPRSTLQTDAVVAYLREITDSVVDRTLRETSPIALVKPFLSELNRLDALLFDEAARPEFIKVKAEFERLKMPLPTDGARFTRAFSALREVLGHCQPSSPDSPRQKFSFLADPDLKSLIESDYEELHWRVFPNRAFKSAVILARSILEAILYDILASPKNASQADTFASGHPKYKKLPPIASERWSLEALIDTAVHLTILPAEDSNIIHQTLRDYRNFIHPMKQRRAMHPIDEDRANLSIRVLDIIITDLEAGYHT